MSSDAGSRLNPERPIVGVGVVVGVAAVNTGNNALFLVEAVLLAVLVASGLLISARNFFAKNAQDLSSCADWPSFINSGLGERLGSQTS